MKPAVRPRVPVAADEVVDAARRSLSADPSRRHKPVVRLVHDGVPYIVKREESRGTRRMRSWLLSAGCAVLFRELVHPAELRAGTLDDEARRLRLLRAHGARVPVVIAEEPGSLVLEDCGEDLADRLGRMAGHERRTLLVQAVDDLSGFHRGGLWHGAAQLRNLTMKNDLLHRVDFEETAGHALPLDLMQAFDLILFFHSALDFLEGDETQAMTLLRRYFRHAPRAGVARALCRIERVTGRLADLESLLARLARKHKDVRRALELARLLRRFCRSQLA